ncbi:BamA/TamA family outer membrane protein [Oceanicola sp. S124]|uniref:BamA/TamA family outer membrane protein n=1 Tax=Oceanicola sp. S124 TaxID=1042378 RepID=UPI00031A5761|nr:BamA/TamA family outer membrane protein [Oceanicola sp. S124]
MKLLPKLPHGRARIARAGSAGHALAGPLGLIGAGVGVAALAGPALTPALAQEAAAPVAVDVRGAEFIAEDKIQATCGVQPGVDYWDEELRAIESCLMLTGVFERVELRREGDVLVIDVTELNTRPGRIEASLSWDSEAGGMAGLSFERYNLLPGTYGALSLSYNDEVARFEGVLYRADAFGDSLDLGLDLAGHRSDYDDQSFAEESLRLEPYLAWTPTPQLRAELGLGYRAYRMYDVAATASPLLMAEESDLIEAPYLRASLQWRSADEGGEAALGAAYAVALAQYAWNLGTDDALLDSRISLDARWSLGDRLQLLAGLDAGRVWGTGGGSSRAIDRFHPGAASFRGFAPRGIGPRDGGEALGGTNFAVASLELQREFDVLNGRSLRGGVFVDVGAAWGLENTLGGSIDDSFHRRSSIGLSVSFDVGQTPVSLYLAEPLEQQPGDRSQAFGISIATRF